ncbi:MAG TPA: coenzyme F420-0:L-glutamate ligase [Terriglobales bacterium]|nr:coenzyme F420-0:L-glutamate ligase [Terriglobales bacterium]
MPRHSDEAVELRAIPITGMGEILPGDSVADAILEALGRQRWKLVPGDILVVKHKIVSKAEAQMVVLDRVRPSAATRRWAARYKLDARVVQLAVEQAKRVVRRRHGVIITETPHGLVCANSGVDVSNVDGGRCAVLLPADPDRSAREIHRAIKKKLGVSVPVLITDSFGRPWREGLCDVAIGVAGMKPFRDFRRQRDPHGYRLRASLEAVADELACTAGLACGKLSRSPACIIRGFRYQAGRGSARQLIRPKSRDLFR